jgi:hypothetical protein
LGLELEVSAGRMVEGEEAGTANAAIAGDGVEGAEVRITSAAFDTEGEDDEEPSGDAEGEPTAEVRITNAAFTKAGDEVVGAGVTPFPARGRVAAAGNSLLRIVSLPEASWAEEGWNETWTTACCLGASTSPGDTFEKAKPEPITVTPEMVSGISPTFKTVMFLVLIEYRS